ncbi:hypothetical protein vseg_016205 [Gypsophila vaccaria]
MSNSMHINDISRFTSDNNNNNNNNNNKMNFSQKFNLLSQFVKDKRAFDVPTNFHASHDGSTMNLFPVKKDDGSNGCVGRTINLFPQISGFNSSMNKRGNPEPPTSQMTIFYRGQVVVFNDLPSEKAKEVMNLASSFESSLKKRKVEPPPSSAPVSVLNAKPSINHNPSSNLNPSQNKAMGAPKYANNVIASTPSLRQASVPSTDLPIARKVSLQRFLEKRKDRLVSKVPSAGTNGPIEGITKPVEGRAWLGLNSLPTFPQKQ